MYLIIDGVKLVVVSNNQIVDDKLPLEALYSPVWGRSCKVSKVCNMSAKNNSDSEYYGRDLVT